MEKLNVEKIKSLEAEILDYVADVCEKNNLKYYLGYGTLLGAVRHKGFIPWDDDVDIFMPRSDYMKLIDIINGEDGNYKCFSVFGGDEYYYPFLKVSDNRTILKNGDFKPIEGMGVNVDIFPLDNFNGKKSLKRKLKIQFYKLVLSWGTKFDKSRSALRNIPKKLLYCIYKNKAPKKYGLKIEKLSAICKAETGTFFVGSTGEEFKSAWFGEGVKLPFEGRNYNCPTDYDAVLKMLYGDYMQLPPEEERVYPHGAEAYKL